MSAIDVGELVEGFAIGRAVKLADWAWRRDEREFRRLCHKLRVQKWLRAIYAEGGDRLEHFLEVRRAWARKPENRAKEAARARRRRRKKHAVESLITCRVCGAQWKRPLRRGRARTLCDAECERKWHARNERQRLAKKAEVSR